MQAKAPLNSIGYKRSIHIHGNVIVKPLQAIPDVLASIEAAPIGAMGENVFIYSKNLSLPECAWSWLSMPFSSHRVLRWTVRGTKYQAPVGGQTQPIYKDQQLWRRFWWEKVTLPQASEHSIILVNFSCSWHSVRPWSSGSEFDEIWFYRLCWWDWDLAYGSLPCY